jgi:hypothetical protein
MLKYERTKNVDKNNGNLVLIPLKIKEVTNETSKRIKRGATTQGR